MKLISVVTPCYNEEENVPEIYKQVKKVMEKLPNYAYEHIFIDNASIDNTVKILKELAGRDKNVKIIVNTRNFGHVRSPYYGMLQAGGDAVTIIAADLQEPPEMIYDFVKKWEEGYKVIVAVKKNSDESKIIFALRKIYYKIVKKLADVELVQNFAGFGMYDKKIFEILKGMNDSYPYFRGLISEIGFERTQIEFVQSVRKKGKTKNSFYTLFDLAMLGMISHSKVPLRIATMAGFLLSIISIFSAFVYFIYKIIFWDSFALGMAPLVIGFFLFSSVQLFFIGMLGEYIGITYTQVLKRPLVIEKERINF